MYWKCNLNQSWLSSPFLVYLRDWQSEISQVQPREDVEVVKEKGITFLFCFLNCFMFKWKMQISLSVSVLEPCGIPQLKYMSCARRTAHCSCCMQEGDEVLEKWQVCYISHFDGAGVKGIWSEEAGEEAEVEFIAVLCRLCTKWEAYFLPYLLCQWARGRVKVFLLAAFKFCRALKLDR